MDTFLEILKYSLPAVVVFLTVYYLFRQFLMGQLQMQSAEFQQKKAERNLPLRLQAYERLALFCERIRVQNLYMRLNSSTMSNEVMAQSMLIAVQKEFEHNLPQQIYVSDNLWKIITLAKDDVMAMINQAASGQGDLLTELNRMIQSRESDPVDQALTAIRQELKFYL